jgi:hypothetical protein
VCGGQRFRYLCERDNEDPETAFQAIVHQTQIPVCGPFNKEARDLTGMPEQWCATGAAFRLRADLLSLCADRDRPSTVRVVGVPSRYVPLQRMRKHPPRVKKHQARRDKQPSSVDHVCDSTPPP